MSLYKNDFTKLYFVGMGAFKGWQTVDGSNTCWSGCCQEGGKQEEREIDG
jgi:hypothetical protein